MGTGQRHLDAEALRELAALLAAGEGRAALVRHNRAWAEHALFCAECEERLERERQRLEWEAIRPAPPAVAAAARPRLLPRISAVFAPTPPAVLAGRDAAAHSPEAGSGEPTWGDDEVRVRAVRRLAGGTEFLLEPLREGMSVAGWLLELTTQGRTLVRTTTDPDGVASAPDLPFDRPTLGAADLRATAPGEGGPA